MSLQAETIARAGGTPSDADIQAMLARAVRLYAERVQSGGVLPAFPPDSPVTATDAMIAVSAVLKAVNVQLFELGMWQAWSGKT